VTPLEIAKMKTGELARRTGVSADTLHYYEKRGLLKPLRRKDNGYREYEEATVVRVEMIQRALNLGFTLNELVPFLQERDSGGSPCQSVRRLAIKKLQEVDRKLEELSSLRSQFVLLIEQWDTKLQSRCDDEQARLLESLPDFKMAHRPKNGQVRSQQ